MGLGVGFMQFMIETNKKDRSQRSSRREKFNGNHSDKGLLDDSNVTLMDFSHLSSEQVKKERTRIQKLFKFQRRKELIIVLTSLIIVGVGFLMIYSIFV